MLQKQLGSSAKRLILICISTLINKWMAVLVFKMEQFQYHNLKTLTFAGLIWQLIKTFYTGLNHIKGYHRYLVFNASHIKINWVEVLCKCRKNSQMNNGSISSLKLICYHMIYQSSDRFSNHLWRRSKFQHKRMIGKRGENSKWPSKKKVSKLIKSKNPKLRNKLFWNHRKVGSHLFS